MRISSRRIPSRRPGAVALAVAALFASGVAGAPAASAQPPAAQAEPLDLAFGTQATQSSTDYGGTADRAVDDGTNGAFSGNSVSHTTEEAQPWWQTDLGSVRDTSRIVVWNRTDCCAGRLSDFWVLTSDRPITAKTVDEARAQPGVEAQHVGSLTGPSVALSVQRPARYVRVQLAGTGYLSLAEVQVYGRETISPSPLAQRWVKQNPFGLFLHYNMSTYDNQQWANPQAPESEFAPTAPVDPDQWAAAMKSAGMTFGVLTAKHHDGFALWDTAASTHDIAASPYHKDLVRQYVDAMHRNGLKVGLYFSIWDRHTGDSLQLVQQQLTELLTRYGPVDYLWFDGWGWQVPYSVVPYAPVRNLIHRLSPNTVVANNDHNGTLQTSDVVVYEVPVQGAPPTTNTRPVDASDTLDTNSTWFHTTATGAPRPAAEIADILKKVNAGNGLYLLDAGPDLAGRIPQDYLDRLAEIGKLRKS